MRNQIKSAEKWTVTAFWKDRRWIRFSNNHESTHYQILISHTWEQVTRRCQFVGKDQAGQSFFRLPTMDSGMFKGATFFKCQGNMVTAVHPTERQVRDVFFPWCTSQNAWLSPMTHWARTMLKILEEMFCWLWDMIKDPRQWRFLPSLSLLICEYYLAYIKEWWLNGVSSFSWNWKCHKLFRTSCFRGLFSATGSWNWPQLLWGIFGPQGCQRGRILMLMMVVQRLSLWLATAWISEPPSYWFRRERLNMVVEILHASGPPPSGEFHVCSSDARMTVN